MTPGSPQMRVAEVVVTLDGDLMENGSVSYRTLLDVLMGTTGAIEEVCHISNLPSRVTFNIKAPREKCFEVTLQAIEYVAAAIPLFQSPTSVQNAITIFLEYLKVLKSLKGEPLKRDRIVENKNGNVQIVNKTGKVVYIDQRKILNVTLLVDANDSLRLGREISKMASALSKDEKLDTLSLSSSDSGEFAMIKTEADSFMFEEKTYEKTDSIVGYVRKVDNRTYKGTVVVMDGEKERTVPFELDIKDVGRLDAIVTNLALAEAHKARVLFVGERIQDNKGKLKKIVISDTQAIDSKLELD